MTKTQMKKRQVARWCYWSKKKIINKCVPHFYSKHCTNVLQDYTELVCHKHTRSDKHSDARDRHMTATSSSSPAWTLCIVYINTRRETGLRESSHREPPCSWDTSKHLVRNFFIIMMNLERAKWHWVELDKFKSNSKHSVPSHKYTSNPK